MNLTGQPATVGRYCGGHEYQATRDVVDFYCEALGDHNPLYQRFAPPLLHHSECYTVLGEWYLKNLFGNLHARQDWDFFAPIPIGARLCTRSTIVERYHKRGRDYVVNETDVCSAENGQIFVRGRTHQSFLPATDRVEEGDGFVVDEGSAGRKGKREDSLRPPFPVATGEEFGSDEKKIDKRRCWMFSGPAANYHTDEQEAKKFGFPRIVVQGMMTTCFVADVMGQRFGEGWLRGGNMSVKLTNVVWADEIVVARARIREVVPEGTKRRVHCDVWVDKTDGVRALLGTASALEDD